MKIFRMFRKEQQVVNPPEGNQTPPVPDHIHEWELILKTFVDPKNISVPNNAELTKLALTGMTTYIFQCVKCGGIKKEEVFGTEESALDRLIDKVEIGGPEYILKDGKTYILLKKPDAPQMSGIPVR